MSNAHKPAYPTFVSDRIENEICQFTDPKASGLTKREVFAIAAMQALLTHAVRRQTIFQRIALFFTGKGRVPVSYGIRTEIAQVSILQADELLKQLEA